MIKEFFIEENGSAITYNLQNKPEHLKINIIKAACTVQSNRFQYPMDAALS